MKRRKTQKYNRNPATKIGEWSISPIGQPEPGKRAVTFCPMLQGGEVTVVLDRGDLDAWVTRQIVALQSIRALASSKR